MIQHSWDDASEEAGTSSSVHHYEHKSHTGVQLRIHYCTKRDRLSVTQYTKIMDSNNINIGVFILCIELWFAVLMTLCTRVSLASCSSHILQILNTFVLMYSLGFLFEPICYYWYTCHCNISSIFFFANNYPQFLVLFSGTMQ